MAGQPARSGDVSVPSAELRIRARRRRDVLDDPAIERAEQRAHRRAIVERVQRGAADEPPPTFDAGGNGPGPCGADAIM